MLCDIFSSMDYTELNMFSNSMSFFIMFTLIMMINSQNWLNTQLNSLNIPLMNLMNKQMFQTSMPMLKASNILITMFIMIIYLNIMGLIPYSFGVSTQLVITMTISLPSWLALIISSAINSPMKFIAHFLPDGAPSWLNPFLVLIETSSIMVRPLTLSFRLAANMSAGHIMLSLMSSYQMASCLSLIMLTALSSMYLLFEVAICAIQAYIFCLLLSLYSNDHS